MKTVKRREFLQVSAASIAALVASQKMQAFENKQISSFQIEEATIADLQAKMQSGELSAQKLTAEYLARIENIDKNGAKLNAVIELNPDAPAIAKQLDDERRAGKIRGALHGIPVLIKDNINTSDKMLTTAGSLALTDNYAREDAFLVKKLRVAGAIILGKTNLSEWANFRSSKSSSGWSGRGGQTRNPYVLDRNPCGSSSGTGAAISANLATVGIGTETDGSIVCPATSCGLVGLKPTVGLVSRSGIIPISHTQDTAGPMTRTVRDAAILLGALVGIDANDAATAMNGKKAESDYTKFLSEDLKGIKIGVARQFFGKNSKLDTLMESCLDALGKQGASFVDVKFPFLEKFGDTENEVLLYEFKADLEKYLASAPTKHKTLQSLIDFNEQNAAREMPYFGQELFLQAANKGDLTERAYLLALKTCKNLTQTQGIDLIMNQNKLDAILAPTGGAAWMTDLINGDCGSHYLGSSSLAAVAGYPNITVPAGNIRELPSGVSFFGRAYSEPVLLKIAYSFEQATKYRTVPKFLPTAG